MIHISFRKMHKPLKRKIYPEDPFFDEGNRECFSSVQTVEEDIDLLLDDIDALRIKEFPCEVKGCQLKFRNPLQFNRHYDMVHRFKCQHCTRNFPSNFLLSMHVQENHDSYFKAQLEKGVHVYRCLLESCTEQFTDLKTRQNHFVSAHKYPSDFRFATTKPKNKKKQTKTKVNERVTKSSLNNSDISITSTKLAKNLSSKVSNDESMEVCDEKENRKKNVRPNFPNSMETDEEKKTEEVRRRIPASFCFGRGAGRGFARGKRR